MSIKQVPESRWNEIDLPFRLCGLPYTMSAFCSQHKLQSFRCPEDDLKTMEAVVIDIEESLFWLFAPADFSAAYDKITVQIRSFESDSLQALNRLLRALNLRRENLLWCHDELGPAKWILFRLDDNGNEFEMNRFLEEGCARLVQQSYIAKGHKQIYSIVKLT